MSTLTALARRVDKLQASMPMCRVSVPARVIIVPNELKDDNDDRKAWIQAEMERQISHGVLPYIKFIILTEKNKIE